MTADSVIRNSAAMKTTVNGRNGSTAEGSTAAATPNARTLPAMAMVQARRRADVDSRGAGEFSGSANVTRASRRGKGGAEANSDRAVSLAFAPRTGQMGGHAHPLRRAGGAQRPQ